jgi:hypothetical protein
VKNRFQNLPFKFNLQRYIMQQGLRSGTIKFNLITARKPA